MERVVEVAVVQIAAADKVDGRGAAIKKGIGRCNQAMRKPPVIPTLFP